MNTNNELAMVVPDPAPVGTPADEQAQNSGPFPLLIAALAIWGVLIWQLSAEWRLNPQYAYGWGVPFVGGYLLWMRWRSRPIAQPTGIITTAVFAAVLLVLWLPLRLVREANMDWRLAEWLMVGEVVLLTFSGLLYAGGWRWIAHFGLSILLILFAIPWPTWIESAAVQGLTQAVTVSAGQLLQWCGVPAWAAGNVIHLPNGPMGVDEACSGIRSLQGSLFAAYFFGELCQLSMMRRVMLITAGFTLAVFLNIARHGFISPGGMAERRQWDRDGPRYGGTACAGRGFRPRGDDRKEAGQI